MDINSLKKCTMCNKTITDIRMVVNLNLKGERKTSTDAWEIMENLRLDTSEVLCPVCFDKFSKLFAQMNDIKEVEE